MRIKLLLVATALLSFVNGIFYLLAPELSLSLLGQSTNAIGVMNTRFFGAAALGIAVITWLAREVESLQFQRSIALGLVITLGSTAVVGFIETLSGTVNWVGWLIVGTDTFLSVGYLLFIFKLRGSD